MIARLKVALEQASTIGDVVKAYQEYASENGAHSDLPEPVWEKIEKARRCQEKLHEEAKEG